MRYTDERCGLCSSTVLVSRQYVIAKRGAAIDVVVGREGWGQ